MTWQVITGDCLDVMPTLEANSVDTIITDPPYGLSFMGKDWDHGIPGPRFWIEALRVAKPGAILLAFGGSRTFHRLAVAIEDAGWEIRDTIMWIYGSGFPKSHDISKAIDKAAGAFKSANSGRYRSNAGLSAIQNGMVQQGAGPAQWANGSNGIQKDAHNPATPAAQEWSGYGTALKPAFEPVLVAMKPLDGTFAENAQRWGVAGMWIDGGRVPANGDVVGWGGNGRNGDSPTAGASRGGNQGGYNYANGEPRPATGRWPANVLHDGSAEVLAGFPVSVARPVKPENIGISGSGEKRGLFGNGSTVQSGYYDTETSAARFFYCAKASRSERNAGDVNNVHPTVKPLSLCRYLARLTKTPTGGVVLDPFAGSGSTGCAAVLEGRAFIGIEQDAEYADIARARISKAAEQARQMELPV